MNKLSYLSVVLTLAVAIFGCVPGNAASDTGTARSSELDKLTNYPRIESFDQGSVQVDFPTLESWPDFRFLKAWLPVEVLLSGGEQPWIGSAYVQALTDIDFDQRTVSISGLKVLQTKFPDKPVPAAVEALVDMAFHGRESIVPLDVLLRLLPDDFEVPQRGGEVSRLNFKPPEIMVSESPLKLLYIDMEPVRAPLQGTQLEYVVNTNWNVFYYRPDATWYVINEGAWQRNNFLSDGDWVTTDRVPEDFNQLALNERWRDVKQALPPKIPQTTPAPFAISLQAAELILLDGAPRLRAIEDTGIRYVSNTESDLFAYSERWYFLVSGRWFETVELSGKWQSVVDLPDAFSQIPSDHDKGHVLFSVPGTRQAKLALIEAALPHRVSVAKHAGLGTEVIWVGEPRFEAIDTTELLRGLNTPFQVIKHNNFHYLCHEGAWFFSDQPNGPWKAAEKIPDEIYRIPASDPFFNVTFVRLDEDPTGDEAYVSYSYSSGYEGSFSTKVSVVYGTGWHYPSRVYWDSNQNPVYWNYGLTYGFNTGYHPVGAYYGGRGAYFGHWGYGGWGPYGYGGWGGYYPQRTTVTIESPAVNYNHGYGSAWEGPLQTTPGDSSKAAGNSLDKFLPKEKVDGTEIFEKISEEDAARPAKLSASSLLADVTLSSHRFSGPEGGVYKREGEEWQQYSEGNWATMDAMQQQVRQAPQPKQTAEVKNNGRWIPAHKKTLSRSDLDRQELARLEGMENYSKYRMSKEPGK